jgi:taurine dioxygenase
MAQGKICMAADVSSLGMTPNLGAEIRGVDLSAPMSDACFTRIIEILDRYLVVFFRRQHLEPQVLARFAARFGDLDARPSIEQSVPGAPQVGLISNVKREGRTEGIVRAGKHWHSDLSYAAVPASVTLLYSVEYPPQGGSTEFVNMYAAYDALPRERQLLVERLRAVHDRGFRYADIYPARPPLTDEERALHPPVEHPLVRVHPKSGRKALYVAKDVVSHILGMGPAESRNLIDELEAFATQPRFAYSHRWQPGDLLVWDNRCTMHRATPYDNKYDRTLFRVQVKGEVPIAQ